MPSRRDVLRASTVSLIAISGCASQNEPPDDETTVKRTTQTTTQQAQTQTGTTRTTTKSIGCTPSALPEEGWPLPDRDPANTNYTPVADNSDEKPSVRWRRRAEPPESHENMRTRFTNPVVTDDRVFVGKALVPGSHTEMPDENSLNAYDRASGDLVWTASTDDEAPRTVATKADAVYASTLNRLYAFGRSDGSNRWIFGPEDSVETMVPTNNRIHVGTGTGSVTALRSDGSIAWTTALTDRITTRPAVHDGALFVGTDDGTLTALRGDDGGERWSRTLSEPDSDESHSVGNLAVTDCGLLVTIGGTVLALDLNGAVRWRVPGGHNVLSTDGTNVYTGTADGHLRAYSIVDGTLRWETFLGIADSQMADGIREDPVVTDGSVFVSSRPETVYSLNKRTGRKQWQLTFDSSHAGKPVVVRDGVFVSAGSMLTALN